MERTVLFYVSGHGFGHAVRAAEVMRALGEHHPDMRVLVRTAAPDGMFAGLPALSRDVMPVEIDSGVSERNGILSIDKEATVGRLKALIVQCDNIVASESKFVAREAISLIVADIPFLPGEIAQGVGIPCIAIGNFTWDWIYEPYLEEQSSGAACLARIRRGYAAMECYLKLPFSHSTEVFRDVIDVPLITRNVRRHREDILKNLGVGDQRPRVVYAMRSPRSLECLARAASESPDWFFFYFAPPQAGMPENTRPVSLNDELSFVDVLTVCDCVVSKLGYGILADCISTHTAILFPPRIGFREDDILVPSAYKYLQACELPIEDYESGEWSSHLQRLATMTEPKHSLATDGAVTCADVLARQARQV
jgi:hypothetical protein